MLDSERARLTALLTYRIMDTSAEPAFDRLTALAANMLQTPVALLSFLDDERLWVKSAFGTEIREAKREHTFCHHTIDRPGHLTVLDTQLDTRFAAIPFAAMPFGPNAPGVRFYAGTPLVSREGARIGSISVMDRSPRISVSEQQLSVLTGLAELAMTLLEERRENLAAAGASERTRLMDSIRCQIAQAPESRSALTEAMRRLGGYCGAAGGQLWHRAAASGTLQPLGAYGDPIAAPAAGGTAPEAIQLLSDTAIRLAQPVAVTIGVAETAADDAIAGSSAEPLHHLLIVPLAAVADEYAVVLGFKTVPVDFSRLVTEMSETRAALKPALDRKTEEERLRLLSSALGTVVDGVLITDVDPADPGRHRVIYVNESVRELTGYAADELIGQNPAMLQGPDSDAATVARFRADLRAGRATHAVIAQYRKDGSKFLAEMSIAPILEARGHTTRFVHLLRDITDKLREERQRRELDESFRLLFEANPLPMWVIDRETLNFRSVNQAAVSFYGWSRDEFLTMTLSDLTPPCADDAQATSADDFEAPEPRVLTQLRADGSVVQVGCMIKPTQLADEDGLLGVAWDMTEVQAARDELRRTNQLLGSLADELRTRTNELTEAHRLAQLGTWRLSGDGREMTWSDEIYSLIGRARSEFPPSPKNALKVIHPDDRKLFEQPLPGAWRDRPGSQIEARIVRADGRMRHVRIGFRPAGNGAEGGLFGYVQDISERKEAEQAVRRSEKLAILGHLTGGVAHDFNNLLTVVTINLEEAISLLPDADTLQDILLPALQAAQRGAELTNHLLAYARQAPLRPTAINLPRFFATCRPMIRHALGRKYDPTISILDDHCTTLVDISQLQTAILNIVLNARDAMPSGGPIEIVAGSGPLPPGEFPANEASPGRFATISVTDRGIGIPPEVMPHIFEPFYTTKDVGSGSGLGLSMVDGFVRQSGGHTMVRSQVGEGTTVTLFLPLTTERPVEPVHTTTRRNRYRALLVDDQPAVLAAAARMFTQLGYEVRAVENAAGALAELELDSDFALLFTDIVLPGGMDGLALSQVVVQRWPDIRILLTSGFSEHNLSQSGVPGAEILMKPYKRQDLIDRLNRIMEPHTADGNPV
jgi:PAS domain S-box-containing protein